MNLLASPKALALLDYIQRHDGRVAIDDLHAAFPADERWIDVLLEADCIDTDGLAVDELPGVTNIHTTHYILLPAGEVALLAKEQPADDPAKLSPGKKRPDRNPGKAEKAGTLAGLISSILGIISVLAEWARALFK